MGDGVSDAGIMCHTLERTCDEGDIGPFPGLEIPQQVSWGIQTKQPTNHNHSGSR